MKTYQRGITIEKMTQTDIIVRVKALSREMADSLIREHMNNLCQQANREPDGDRCIGFVGHVGDWDDDSYAIFGMANNDYSDTERHYPIPNIDLTKDAK